MKRALGFGLSLPLFAALGLLNAPLLPAETRARATPVFPPEVPGLVYLEGEDAISTNFAREPTMDYGSSGFRVLQLNREPQASGLPFFSEYSLIVGEEGSYGLWMGGTPPGPGGELYPSYASPFSLRIDGGEPRIIHREDVDVVENYSTTGYWYLIRQPIALTKGAHTLRVEVAERRRYDSRYYFSIDALFLLEARSPVGQGTVDRSLLPARFPRDLADRSINDPYLSIAQYEAAIQARPLQRETYLLLARVYGLLGDYGNALKVLARGGLVAGEDPRFTLLAAKNRIWSGDVDEGLRLYRAYLATPGADVSVWAEAAKVSAWLGKYQEALALYREALVLFPADLNLQVNYGLTLLWAGRVGEGQTALAAALEAAKAGPAKIEELGGILGVNGYPDRAKSAYAEGIKLYPDELELYLVAARAELATGNEAGARALEATIRDRFVPSDRLDSLLAKFDQDSGLKKAALARYEERLAAAPDDLDLRRELVRAYYWNGRLEEAVKANGDILVNLLYRFVGDFERDLPETWRYLDFIQVFALRLPSLVERARSEAEGLSRDLLAWKKAGDEAAKAGGTKDQVRKDRADAAFAEAGARLSSSLAEAEDLASRAGAALASARALGEASAAEAARRGEDEATLGKLGAWRWERASDLAVLAEKAAKGNALAASVLDRVDLALGKPSLVRSRATFGAVLAAPAGSPGTTPAAAADPQGARARAEAAVWLDGLPPPGYSLAAPAYFAHGAALEGLIATLAALAPSTPPAATSAPPASPLESGAALAAEGSAAPSVPPPPEAAERAAQAMDALRKVASDTSSLGEDLRAQALALEARAQARLKLRWYQFDLEAATERRERADIWLKLDRPLDAKVELERVLAVAPGDVQALFTLGRAMDLAGDWSGAMGRYKQVWSLDPRFENTASAYNRLARGHADRFTATSSASVDSSRTATSTRLEYAAGGSSLMSLGGSFAIDDLRVHSPYGGSKPGATSLESLDLTLKLNFLGLGAAAEATIGGVLDNRLWGSASSSLAPFQPADLASSFEAAPRLGAGLTWGRGPYSLAASWTFDQLSDSFLPGRQAWFENQGEATLSAWYGIQAPSRLRSASARLYARAQQVFSPFSTAENFLFAAVGEGSLAFLLVEAPWTTLTLGGALDFEDSAHPGVPDYYAPGSVLSAKGGLQLATWLGLSEGWVAGLSGRVWGGWWRDASSGSPTFDGLLRAELSKGDLSLWFEAVGSRTGDLSAAVYWSALARLGGTISIPSYIIP